MQISKDKVVFTPIQMTLQSQEEVDWLYEITRHISGTGKVRDFFDSIASGLIQESLFHKDVGYEEVFSRNSRMEIQK